MPFGRTSDRAGGSGGSSAAGTPALSRQSSRGFMAGLSVARPNRYRQSSAGTNRNSTRRLTLTMNSNSNSNDAERSSQFINPVRPKAAYRRYRVGEHVLICCNSHWATLVNRYGFPPGEGTTAEEQNGPYSFVMATIQTVHFDEFAEYYTVKRADTGGEQRADTGRYCIYGHENAFHLSLIWCRGFF